MDWANERYVRLFTRDTEDWLLLSWEARALLIFMIRKADATGRNATKRGATGLAALVTMPTDVVARAVHELMVIGCVVETADGYLIPNFMDAQETPSSQLKRSREHRERAKRNTLQRVVTGSNGSQHDDTLNHTELNPTKNPLKPPRKKRANATRESAAAIGAFNKYFEQARDPAAWNNEVRKALAAGFTEEEIRGAFWGAFTRCAKDAEVVANFTPGSVLRLRSREGKTVLPQWLEIANEEWGRRNPGKPCPWKQTEEESNAA